MTSIIGAGTGNAEQRRQFERYAYIRHRLMYGFPRIARQVLIELPNLPEQPAEAVLPAPRPRRLLVSTRLDMLAPPSIRFLIQIAALRHRMSVHRLLSRERKHPVVQARHEAIALVYQHTQLSLPGVGRHFGLHHTTILNSLRQSGVHHKLVELRPAIEAQRRPKLPVNSLQHHAGLARTAHSKKVAERIRRSYAAGKSPEQISEDIGYRPATVRTILKRLEVPPSSREAMSP